MFFLRYFFKIILKQSDLRLGDWGGPWSDKSLVALQEVSVRFSADRPGADAVKGVAKATPSGVAGYDSTIAENCSFFRVFQLEAQYVARPI